MDHFLEAGEELNPGHKAIADIVPSSGRPSSSNLEASGEA